MSGTTVRILRHPANRGRRARALGLYVTWQVWERLVRRPWTIRLGDTRRIRLHPHETVPALVLYCRVPDYEEMSFVRHYLKPGDLFVDVGANAGLYSLWASEVDGVDVLAFEPSTLACSRALGNVELNGLSDRIEVRRQAVGARSGSTRLTTRLAAGNHVVADGTEAAVEVEVVEQTTLDEALGERKPALVKIDVEGAELDVLRGGRQAILRHRPALLIEVNDPEGLAALLGELGYERFRYEPSNRAISPICPQLRANVIALADGGRARDRLGGEPDEPAPVEPPRPLGRPHVGDGLDRGIRVLRQRGPRAAALGAVGEVRARLELARWRRRPPQAFSVDGVEHIQLVHLYNRTWRNERAVEIPLALAFLERQTGPVLELGNVLTNYGRHGHVVVDKYERRRGVLNVDVVEFRPEERFGAIVAISTLEHVGWDEEPRDPAKISRAVAHLRHLLLPSGRLFVTCPLSYNPHLDALITAGVPGVDRQAFLVSHGGRWVQVDQGEAFARARVGPHGASALWVGELVP
jgi:FkbM family methyltransferase